jgi:hypothetical protein
VSILIGEYRVSAHKFQKYMRARWDEIKAGKCESSMPTWCSCIFYRIDVTTNDGLYLRLWDTNIDAIKKIEILCGEDGKIGGKELVAADIFENGGLFPSDMAHYAFAGAAIDLGLIKEKKEPLAGKFKNSCCSF